MKTLIPAACAALLAVQVHAAKPINSYNFV